jgi:hypothetical protein
VGPQHSDKLELLWTVTWMYVSHKAQKWHLSYYPFQQICMDGCVCVMG